MFIIDNETPVSHVYKLEPDHPTYNDLHLLDYNRPVSKDNHNVINISKSMKENNLLYAAPIIVKYTPDRLEIIDGQHRYLAAKSLNLPIYIHVLKDQRTFPGEEKKLITTLNSNQKNWGLGDFAYHYSKVNDNKISEKYSEYLTIYDMFNSSDGPGITHGILICITQGRTTRSGNNIEFKSGQLEWNNSIKQELYHICKVFKEIKSRASQPVLTDQTMKKQQFQTAILTALKNPQFNYKRFIKNLHTVNNSFNKLSKKIDMIAEIYRIEIN